VQGVFSAKPTVFVKFQLIRCGSLIFGC